jgi:hypothetical protein
VGGRSDGRLEGLRSRRRQREDAENNEEVVECEPQIEHKGQRGKWQGAGWDQGQRQRRWMRR